MGPQLDFETEKNIRGFTPCKIVKRKATDGTDRDGRDGQGLNLCRRGDVVERDFLIPADVTIQRHSHA